MHTKRFYDQMKRQVLIVDDEIVNRKILGSVLEDEYELLFAGDGEEALKVIEEYKDNLSIVLLDFMMPKINGFEVIKTMKADPVLTRIPIIVLTSDKSTEIDSLKLGASDFITKPYDSPEVIKARVKRLIELSEDRLIIRSTEKDELTGLYSKTFFYEYAGVLDKYEQSEDMDAVVIDIDHFHLINEIFGRSFGDTVLKKVASIIKGYSEDLSGIAGRGDADVFYLYVKHQKDYKELVARIKDEMKEAYQTNNIRARVGVCEKSSEVTNVEQLFDRAKLAGNTIRGTFQKNIAFFDEELKAESFFNEQLIHDIYEGFNQKQFMPYFQPKYDVTGEKPVLKGAEALIRWKHPEYGIMSPGSFVDLFEENGLIQMVDNYLWGEAAAQLKEWKKKYSQPFAISVNVSRIDIYDPEIENKLLKLVESNGLDVKDFHIEITESAYADNPDHMIEKVERLRKKGFIVEMDDFGAGYSALNMIASMPIDILKLDMQFVRTMFENERNMRMVEIIMDIAKLLKVPVVVEGVETKEQLDCLVGMGCQMIQGYYFSKPVSAEEFEKFFES
ncbi:two-component system response regulator [Butyrivibrio sp. INlla14]|uniref:two-component system response regulator n=1 Tax=Butyrivibrio sp. INlla14 TaxID=1520808 RepID=UPI0008763C73|nr:EAL domain-containing protein [Butyrivibrio sp. INlla14]SCY16680.1 diguanylate cyclase (GGDEF) domain-containing protein [Butyrivibrio sp. INlla14]